MRRLQAPRTGSRSDSVVHKVPAHHQPQVPLLRRRQLHPVKMRTLGAPGDYCCGLPIAICVSFRDSLCLLGMPSTKKV